METRHERAQRLIMEHSHYGKLGAEDRTVLMIEGAGGASAEILRMLEVHGVANVEVHATEGQNIDGKTVHLQVNGASLSVGPDVDLFDIPQVREKVKPESTLHLIGNRKQRRAKESDWRRKHKRKGWF